MIFCRSKKAAERTMEHILPHIEKKLFLKVNREKTQVAYIGKVKYLGYGFYVYKGEGRLKVHPKSIRKLKDKIRGITGRSNGMSRSEEHTSELQSRPHLVCRLLLEKNNEAVRVAGQGP